MSDGQVKKYIARLYFLECLGDRTTKNLGVLVQRISEHLKIFLPLCIQGTSLMRKQTICALLLAMRTVFCYQQV